MNAKAILLVLIVGVAATQAINLDHLGLLDVGTLTNIRILSDVAVKTILTSVCNTVDGLLSDRIVGTLNTPELDAVAKLFTKRAVTLADADATLTDRTLDLNVIAPVLGFICPNLRDFRLVGDADFDLTKLGKLSNLL